MRSSDAAPSGPCLWAIGGGKGGIGKTVVASSLGVAFARRGRRCVVVDADLGGANLHSLLGVPRPQRTLSEFLRGDVSSLAAVACRTPVPNLWLVSGADALFDAANPAHAQKRKLLRHLHRLNADHVFIDLGAGSSFNVLDFFLAARRGILLVTPEPTAIENTYQFLKAAWFRSLRDAAARPGVKEAVREALRKRSGRAQVPLALIADVALIDTDAAAYLANAAARFAPQLLVNQVSSPEQRRLGPHLVEECRNALGANVEYLGALERDESVRSAVDRGRPVLDLFPGCEFADDLQGLVDRLLPEPTLDPASVPEPPQLDLSQPGAALRRRREQLGLRLPALARRMRIRSLESLESERFEQLPPEPYLRAHLLQYARELGLRDPDALATSFLARYRDSGASRSIA